jgi:hypothetical protein
MSSLLHVIPTSIAKVMKGDGIFLNGGKLSSKKIIIQIDFKQK